MGVRHCLAPQNNKQNARQFSDLLGIMQRFAEPVLSKMPDDQNGNASTSRVARCAVTNGKALHLFGDGRSAGARRYRDLLAAFASEAGGMDSLAASAQQVIRRLAQVSVELELLDATRASGQTIDPVAYVTLVNTQRRLLRDLERMKPKAKPSRGDALQRHLAERYGAAQPKEAA